MYRLRVMEVWHNRTRSTSQMKISFSIELMLILLAVQFWLLQLFGSRSDNGMALTRSSLPLTDDLTEDGLHNQTERFQEYLRCEHQYSRFKTTQLPGLSVDDYRRSRAYYGNVRKLSHIVEKLLRFSPNVFNGKVSSSDGVSDVSPLQVVVCGGSITLGHGVNPKELRYAEMLENWLNEVFPLTMKVSRDVSRALQQRRLKSLKQEQQQQQEHYKELEQLQQEQQEQQRHKVFLKGSHGADMCALAKRFEIIDFPENPDLFVLEFGVNDFHGQDHLLHTNDKTDVFFEGFERLALCCETVVAKIIATYPNAAIVFLEFQSAILTRKTAQLLHTGVAQHYQIPVVSFADTMFPPYYELIRRLEEHHNGNNTFLYSAPGNASLLPFPHGCSPCELQTITEQFRKYGCTSVCKFMMASMRKNGRTGCNEEQLLTVQQQEQDHRQCHLSFLHHDAVHPTAVGHRIARDILVEALAVTAKDLCYHSSNTSRGDTVPTYHHDGVPLDIGWMTSSTSVGMKHGSYVLVQDTRPTFTNPNLLLSTNHSSGFKLTNDGVGANRVGWISTNPEGNEYIEFDFDLVTNSSKTTNTNISSTTNTTTTTDINSDASCYVVYITVLKSYENMGTFTVQLFDQATQNLVSLMDADGIWKPRISIPFDIQLNDDKGHVTFNNKTAYPNTCTGKCTVTITTHPQVEGRKRNKVVITSLSVRKCV